MATHDERPNDPNQKPDTQNTNDVYDDLFLRILRVTLVIMLLLTLVNVILLINSKIPAKRFSTLSKVDSISSISPDPAILQPVNPLFFENLRLNLDESNPPTNYT